MRVGLGADFSTGPNPYTQVVWVQKDPVTLTWYHYGADNQLLFITRGDGTVEAAPGAVLSPALQSQLAETNRQQAQYAASQPLSAASGPRAMTLTTQTAPTTPTTPNYVAPASSFFQNSVDVGGFNLPVWGLLAGGAAALFFLGRGR